MTSRDPAILAYFQALTPPDKVPGKGPASGFQGAEASAPAFKAVIFFWIVVLMAVIVLLTAEISQAGTPITLYRSFAGDLDYVGTGGTLRTQPNTVNACAVTTSGSGTLSGIPAGASVRAAYLYWAGSYSVSGGSTQTTPDYNVTFAGQNITADRTFTETFTYNGTDYDYFSGVRDVTAIVASRGNGIYTFANLSVNTGTPHCGVQAVVAGWSLVVIYADASQPLRVVNVFDGFQYYRGSEIVLIPSNFQIPSNPIDGKHSCISWEGDVENSAPLNGFTENLLFNNNPLIDGYNPLNNQFNSSINFLGSTSAYGVDFDAYDISAYLTAGATSAVSAYRSGGDLVLLSAEVISVTNTPVADLSIIKSHTGTFTAGQSGEYRLIVSNAGPNTDAGPITVTETLPAGLTYVASTGDGWTVDTSAAPTIVWTHPGPLAPHTSLPTVTLTVAVSSAALPSVTNTAQVTSPTFDNNMANNSTWDPTTVLGPDAANKPLYLYGEPGRNLSRTPPSGTEAETTLNGNSTSATWALSPVTAGNLVLPAGLHPVRLWIARNNRGSSRTVAVSLASTGATVTSLGNPVSQTFTIPSGIDNATEITFNLNLPSAVTLLPGSQITLTVINATNRRNRRVIVVPVSSGNYSRVDLNARSVISIQSIAAFDAPYPGGNEPVNFMPGAVAYLRTVVSDPFGSFDIDRALIVLVNPSRVTVVFEARMPEVFDSGADTKIFEYAFTIPVNGDGTWTTRIRAHEGTEAIVNDVAQGTFVVGLTQPDILFLKTAATLNDPFNGATDPKAIPGAEVLYTLRATNQGPGVSDTDSVVLIDPIPADTELYVADMAAPGAGPIVFTDMPTPSGLTYSFTGLGSLTDDLAFSTDNGANYDYAPNPNTDGFDPAVTHIRITPQGVLFGDSGIGSPGFEIRYKVRIR